MLFIFLLSSIPALQAQADFVGDPMAPTVEVGSPLTVTIKVDITGGVVDGAEAHLNFDNTLLAVTSITALSTTVLPEEMVAPAFDNGAGTIVYAAGVLGSGNEATADFDFLEITFNTLATGSTSLQFNSTVPRKTDISSGGSLVLGTASNIPITINGVDLPPVVSITSPSDGASFTEGADVLIQATATDDIGIVNVEFYDGPTLLGSDNTADTGPDEYTFTINNIAVGSYALTAVAYDASGSTTSSVVNINVNPPVNLPPEITLLGDNPLELNVGDTYVEAGATATDDVDGDISGSIVIDATAVDVNTPGSYPVTYNVTDSGGLPATEVIRTVNVSDVTAPVITLLGDNPLELNVGDTYTEAGATATDDVDGDLTA
ncbi:MAG: DUF5011 domain-containing protein, partial [Eudoraea sp.]|nr:DUF5011 domain-containing protein [Eudoraea sp.]